MLPIIINGIYISLVRAILLVSAILARIFAVYVLHQTYPLTIFIFYFWEGFSSELWHKKVVRIHSRSKTSTDEDHVQRFSA